MSYLFLCFVFPIINAFVAVEIHRNCYYNSSVICSFIGNTTWSKDVSIESCIWECVYNSNCQTATFFQVEKICSLFFERCQKDSIQSYPNHLINVICYRKNHDPIPTCSSTLTTNQRYEESTNILTTTHTKSIIRLTRDNDPIFGIRKTSVGRNSTPSDISGLNSCNFPSGEFPSNAIDNNNSTKYTNFGDGYAHSLSITNGCDTGFYVTPSIGPTILKAIQFLTGNNLEGRDPMTITVEGTNLTLLTIGSTWTLIYSGSTGLYPDPGRYSLGLEQSLNNNTIAYTSYRLLTTSKRALDDSVQYSEAILLGYQ